MKAPLFDERFRLERRRVNGIELNVRYGGSGPPLLLLHGFPQTHAIWHRWRRASRTLHRGAGGSARLRGFCDKPEGPQDHANYSKREMAQDMVDLMRGLGLERFFVVGHDRGGRVAHRMALDHADAVERLVVLDIAPTLTMYDQTKKEFAAALFPVVLSDPARPPAGEAHRRRPDILLAAPDRRLGLERRRRSSTNGASPNMCAASAPRHPSRDLRGLPRGRIDRSRARPADATGASPARCGRSGASAASCTSCSHPWPTGRRKARSVVTGRATPTGHYIPKKRRRCCPDICARSSATRCRDASDPRRSGRAPVRRCRPREAGGRGRRLPERRRGAAGGGGAAAVVRIVQRSARIGQRTRAEALQPGHGVRLGIQLRRGACVRFVPPR